MREQLRQGCADAATYRACFVDYDEPADEGLAGFVLGTLSERTESMRVNVVRDRAHVFPDPGARGDRSVVLVKTDAGWKVSLAESVPQAVQREMQRLRAQFE
jgi:hypothetical protein